MTRLESILKRHEIDDQTISSVMQELGNARMIDAPDFRFWFDFDAPANEWKSLTASEVLEVMGEPNASHARHVQIGVLMAKQFGNRGVSVSNGKTRRLMPPVSLY